ncbi:MAB_1171c family putative transporter [Streptomyces tendae]|uniref:MAB_1171c family putative transporter n=1 Tax=Streptomyces tendae TaxID=1932 RepID=UPI0037198196
MSFSISFFLIAVALGIGLCYKLPAVLNAGRNPLARQVAGLLLAACAVFFFAAPSTIATVNDITGVSNFSGPWVYSLLTGFSASCLLLIAKWRGGTPDSLRRTTWWVYGSYGTLIAVLWMCFVLSDHGVERVRDLDTYYATTPWMREMIVLYLLGHTVAVLITCALLWTWESRVRGTGWLHAGVVLLSIGYVLNFGYDATKLTAVVGRWTGTDLDHLSTDVAPPVAGLSGILVALGFIVPHAGERMSQRLTARREYWALRPLAHLLHPVPAAAAPVTLGRFAPLHLRLTHRKTFVRDALRQLQPHLNFQRRDHLCEFYSGRGKPTKDAQALADAMIIVAAVAQMENTSGSASGQEQRPALDSLSELAAISRALRDLPRAQPAPRNEPTTEESVTP